MEKPHSGQPGAGGSNLPTAEGTGLLHIQHGGEVVQVLRGASRGLGYGAALPNLAQTWGLWEAVCQRVCPESILYV